MTTTTEIKRGDIFYAKLTGDGHIQNGCRPVIIISNDKNNRYSPIVQVVPLTSQDKSPLPVHVQIEAKNNGLTRPSTALVEQLMVLNKYSLGNKIGSASNEVLNGIERAICIQFGFAA